LRHQGCGLRRARAIFTGDAYNPEAHRQQAYGADPLLVKRILRADHDLAFCGGDSVHRPTQVDLSLNSSSVSRWLSSC
jgi:hypothetical protein